ncbi:phosphatidylserine synthase, putative [Eimeria tenella]|uniref:Phosphatidylserine synthase, putative n=1 Tax=Eimeria tenella TaxID=5802 RepID=U6KWS2_EIMTE|nr:phosphatidylserine synthase, putative [Eimeria tenella]AIB09107.1 putative phosphatidylthreonine synthase [Eimeria tenella]CDJ42406.1 phosphatidylserine synthase, putative [Eimeria tenella]|eukprot:XP_013233156.1 phosphatidylserine synthase, putative [Eimeria tenella]
MRVSRGQAPTGGPGGAPAALSPWGRLWAAAWRPAAAAAAAAAEGAAAAAASGGGASGAPRGRAGGPPGWGLGSVGAGAGLLLLLAGALPPLLASWGPAAQGLSVAALPAAQQQELRALLLRSLGSTALPLCLYLAFLLQQAQVQQPQAQQALAWSAVHGAGACYLLLLLLLLALPARLCRELLQLLLPGCCSGGNVFTGTLILDCSLRRSTLLRQLRSPWFASHALGWFLKMSLYRSWPCALALSLLFEAAEASLHWLLPEFQECWWDSVVLDAVLSNLLGMTPRHLAMTGLLLGLSLLAELNVFFLMTALDLHATHWVNPLRLLLLGLLAFPAVAEFYAQLQRSSSSSSSSSGGGVGPNVFLFVFILAAETLVAAKYGRDRFHYKSPPKDVLLPWILAAALFAAWCCSYFSQQQGGPPPPGGPQAQGGPPGEDAEKACEGACGVFRTLNNFKRSAARLLLKMPPQACFIPLLYLAKNYYYGEPHTPQPAP